VLGDGQERTCSLLLRMTRAAGRSATGATPSFGRIRICLSTDSGGGGPRAVDSGRCLRVPLQPRNF